MNSRVVPLKHWKNVAPNISLPLLSARVRNKKLVAFAATNGAASCLEASLSFHQMASERLRMDESADQQSHDVLLGHFPHQDSEANVDIAVAEPLHEGASLRHDDPASCLKCCSTIFCTDLAQVHSLVWSCCVVC